MKKTNLKAQGQGEDHASAPAQELGRHYFDLPYTLRADSKTLDIYLPEEGDAPYPVVLFIHGRGFAAGNKRDGQLRRVLPLLSAGYAIASVEYSLSGEAKFPRQLIELKAAVRFLRAHALEYGLDPRHIIASGCSAGGYLASMLAVTAGRAEFDDLSLGYVRQSDDVQAVVAFYPGLDHSAIDGQFATRGVKREIPAVDEPGSYEERFFGSRLRVDPALAHAADPASYLGQDTPPFWIIHGTADTCIPIEQSISFMQKLRPIIGSRAHLTILEGGDHGYDPRYGAPETISSILSFLAVNLV